MAENIPKFLFFPNFLSLIKSIYYGLVDYINIATAYQNYLVSFITLVRFSSPLEFLNNLQ
jgi:hypothetical protein